MQYLEYREKRQQGTFRFPVAFYHVTPEHPRYSMPYHWHPEYEIIHILEGKFQLVINEETYQLEKGDIAMIQSGILHGGEPVDCIYECVVFDLEKMLGEKSFWNEQWKEFLDVNGRIRPLLSAEKYPEFKVCVTQLFRALAGRQQGYEFVVLGTITCLIGSLINHCWCMQEVASGTIPQRHLRQMKKVLQYIEEHYPEDISLKDLAVESGMNEKYFCRFFRAMTMRTPMDYVNYYRIERSCAKMIVSNESITEIALSHGFNDVSHFIKTFKKYKNCTPRKYMKLEKEK